MFHYVKTFGKVFLSSLSLVVGNKAMWNLCMYECKEHVLVHEIAMETELERA